MIPTVFGSTLDPECLGTTQHRSMIISPSLTCEFLDAHTDVYSCQLRKRHVKLDQGLTEVHGDIQSQVRCRECVVGAGCHQIAGKNSRGHPRSQSPRALKARQGRSACTTSFQRLAACIVQQGTRPCHALLLSRDMDGFPLADVCFSGTRPSRTILKHRRHRDCHKENDPILNAFPLNNTNSNHFGTRQGFCQAIFLEILCQ